MFMYIVQGTRDIAFFQKTTQFDKILNIQVKERAGHEIKNQQQGRQKQP
jgi:hypothetical protein